jgi:hypothetical protein
VHERVIHMARLLLALLAATLLVLPAASANPARRDLDVNLQADPIVQATIAYCLVWKPEVTIHHGWPLVSVGHTDVCMVPSPCDRVCRLPPDYVQILQG